MNWHTILADRNVVGLVAYRFAYTAGIGVIWGFLPVLADAELKLSSAKIGVLVMLGVLVSGVVQLPMGRLADRVNRKTMVAVGGVLVAVAMFSYQRAFSFEYLFIVSLMFGFGGGISMPALMAIAVTKGQEADAMGSVIALLTMAHSMGMLVGSVGAGMMMDCFNLRLTFFIGGLLMCAGMAVFLICVTGLKDGGSAQILQ